MPGEDLRFLHWLRTERCTALMDKRFVGYSTLQHIAAGQVDLAYAGHWRSYGPGWFWPHHPGPRIALRPSAQPGWWTHCYVAVSGPLLERWRADGLWPTAPQPAPAGMDAVAEFDALFALLPCDSPLRWRRAVNRLEGILLALAEARQRTGMPAWLAQARAALAAPEGFHAEVARIAADAGMPVSTFRRRFAAATGCSPQAFALAARLERARQLLADTDADIAAIAARLGYRDVFFFSRQFRQAIGMPPATYRRGVQDGA
jgi:AraC-like DNA-binding protein